MGRGALGEKDEKAGPGGAAAGSGPRGGRGELVARQAATIVAFACFFATLPIYSPNIVALNATGVPQVTAWFSKGVLLLSIASSAAVAACSAFGKRVPGMDGAAPLALYFIGVVAYSGLLAFGSEASSAALDALALACALLAGAGLVPACVRWGAVFAGGRLSGLLGVCGSGVALAALANLAVSGLPLAGALALHACMLALGTFAPVGLRRRAVGAGQPGAPLPAKPARPAAAARRPMPGAAAASPAAARPVEPPEKASPLVPSFETAPSRAARARAFMSVMGTPLLGIALSSFVIGIAPTKVFGGAADTQTLGAIAAAAVLGAALAAARRRGVPTSALVQRMLLPLSAACALAVCAFPGVGADWRALACYTLFSLVGVVALAMGSGISNAGEFPRPFVFATLVGTYCLTAVLGLAVGSLLSGASDYHADIVVALTCAYGLLAVGVACAHAVSPGSEVLDDGVLGPAAGASPSAPGAEEAAGPDASAVPGLSPSLDLRADLLARSFGLTPREEEIVRILARGHGCGFVADTLLISKSTVYTHVRNIYRKLDVSNHDQLIQLLDQQVA